MKYFIKEVLLSRQNHHVTNIINHDNVNPSSSSTETEIQTFIEIFINQGKHLNVDIKNK